MKIQIKNRFNLSVIFECEADSIKLAVELAIKQRADLSKANLSEVDLSRANLSRADLSRAELSGANLYEANLSGAILYGANLYEANLSRADLSRAELSEANLSEANLSGAILYGANLYGEKIDKIPIQISGLIWWINITKKHIQIGCKTHEAEKWFNFTDDEISEMHEDALTFWKVNKEFIRQAWEHHCKE
jgi:uncharacterized protein YjbI with pentapeptide repeats